MEKIFKQRIMIDTLEQHLKWLHKAFSEYKQQAVVILTDTKIIPEAGMDTKMDGARPTERYMRWCNRFRAEIRETEGRIQNLKRLELIQMHG